MGKKSDRLASDLYWLSMMINAYAKQREALAKHVGKMHDTGWLNEDIAKRSGLDIKFIKELIKEARDGSQGN